MQGMGKQRVLVVQLKRIGDVIVSLPLLDKLLQRGEEYEVELIIAEETQGMIPMLDKRLRVHVWKNGNGNWKFLHRLLGRAWSEVYDLTGTDRSAGIVLATGGEKRVGFVKWRTGWKKLVYNMAVESLVREEHTVDHYLNLIRSSDASKNQKENEISIPRLRRPEGTEEKQRIAEKISHILGSNRHEKYAVLHVGTARSEKMWKEGGWVEVIHYLQERCFLKVILTGGGSAEEETQIQKLMDLAGGTENLISANGVFTLQEFAELLAGAEILVGVDSSPSHLADALGVRQVVLYGPTNPFHWRPRGGMAKVVLAGQGEVEEFFPYHERLDMQHIKTEDVLSAIESARLLPVTEMNIMI